MAEDAQFDVLVPEEVFGSLGFSATVRVTNTSRDEIRELAVIPALFPGRLLKLGEDKDENSPISKLELTKRGLLREMEEQLEAAYERHSRAQMGSLQKIWILVSPLLQTFFSLPLGNFQSAGRPSWATEALKIHTWDDVKRLETDVIATEPPESFLRKAFTINKEKLERCLSNLENEHGKQPISAGDTLSPGATISYPFMFRAPHVLRKKSAETQFRVTFRKGNATSINQRSVSKTFPILASPFAVATGSIVGTACGYGIRYGLKSASGASSNPSVINFVASLLLGLTLAIIMSRKAEGKKPITVEDFVGGFLIGAGAGLFSEQALKRLTKFVEPS